MKGSILKKLVAAIIFSLIASFNAYAAYPVAKVTNKTAFPAKGEINYASGLCKNDKFSVAPGKTWKAKSRGACLITWIKAHLTGTKKTVTKYTSSGTSYSNFIIQATPTDYRIWSDHEMAREKAKSREGKSPGFYILNKTDWPLSISLNQVGCLYYDTIKKGEIFKRNTGAVWFTIKVNIQPDGKEPRTDWDCIAPVAEIVGAVIIAAATGGYGAFLIPEATTASVMIAAGGATIAPLGKFTAKQVGELLKKNGEGELKGQYAGFEWPFRCNKMPTYHITGGPELKVVDGKVVISEGTPMKITKQNKCGNSMM